MKNITIVTEEEFDKIANLISEIIINQYKEDLKNEVITYNFEDFNFIDKEYLKNKVNNTCFDIFEILGILTPWDNY